MAELDILMRCRAARPGEKSVDGLVVERDEQAERDAKLGAMVRAMPPGYDLSHGYTMANELLWFVIGGGGGRTVAKSSTPEGALALGLGKIEAQERGSGQTSAYECPKARC